MQPIAPPTPDQLAEIEKAIEPSRLQRYMPAAEADKARAFAFYLWNCSLCEAFFLPVHFAEITSRNLLNRSLVSIFGPGWYDGGTFSKIYDSGRFSTELQTAVRGETLQHKSSTNSDHVASALTFGFWEHLATKRFDRTIWRKGVRSVFPGAPVNATRENLQSLMESVRRWRNRISHHNAIFDKNPSRKYQECLTLIEWASPTTADWIKSAAKVQQVINLRPSTSQI